jgi:L-gulonate 5-dehydrogenase
MLAVIVERPHRLALVSSPDESLGPTDVLVRVISAGICGSDIHILHGSNPFVRTPESSATKWRDGWRRLAAA